MQQFFESKISRRFELMLFIILLLFGILFLFFKGFFLGFLFSILGIVGGIFSIRRQNKNKAILEINDKGITFPYKGRPLFIEYNDISKFEKKTDLFFTDGVTGSYFSLSLKSQEKPIKINFPDLGIDEDEIVRVINQALKRHLSNG
jgi:hypothetical protein